MEREIPQKSNMDWWHKMRKACFAVSSRLKFRKSGSGGRTGGAAHRSSSSLLKLQDDVQMCGYRDVEVMWNMFIESNPEQRAAAFVSSTSKPTSKQNQKPSLRSFFWSQNTTTTTKTSFASFNQVIITTEQKKY